MQKILIIGGCGYIGSALNLFLTELGYETQTVDKEIFGNYNSKENYKIDYDDLSTKYLDSFDVIILTAANSSVNLCVDLFDTYENNINKFFKLLKKIKKQKFIYASSSCVYVDSKYEQKQEDSPLFPVDNLTFSKTTIDNLASLSDVEFYGMRFGSVNGWSPNLRLDLMINAMTISAIENKKVTIFNKNMYRPILSISDLCSGILSVIENPKDNRGIYNMASFNESIENIGKIVAKSTKSEIEYGNDSFTYNFKICSDKFKNVFDFEFDNNVNSIIDSILKNPINDSWTKRELINVKV